MSALATISVDELTYVNGGGLSFNAPITVGTGNEVSAGAGTWGINVPVTVGNNNTITTGKGPTFPITLGFNNKVQQK